VVSVLPRLVSAHAGVVVRHDWACQGVTRTTSLPCALQAGHAGPHRLGEREEDTCDSCGRRRFLRSVVVGGESFEVCATCALVATG
jgi:hypothetical protein